jgi:hypothetical protein
MLWNTLLSAHSKNIKVLSEKAGNQLFDSFAEEATHPLVHKMGERRELNEIGKGSPDSPDDGPVTEESCQSAIMLFLY